MDGGAVVTRGRFGVLLDAVGHPYFGALSEDKKRKIIEYLNAPSLEGWRDIRRIIIGQRGNYFTNIFVVVKDIDSSFGDYVASYFKYPDALTVARALRRFVETG